MPKHVLSVGQCAVDHAAILRLIEGGYDAQVVPAATLDEALARLRASHCDLVLVNRKLDADQSDGLEVVRRIRADPRLAAIPVMLVTNYAQHQQEAIAAGAEPGFGKTQLDDPATGDKLRRFLV